MRWFGLMLLGLLIACGGASAKRHTPAEVLAAFTAAHLDVGTVKPMVEDGGIALYKCVDGLHFLVPDGSSFGTSSRVWDCPDRAGRDGLVTYLRSLGSPISSWVYVHDSNVVELDPTIPATEAARYAAALNAMP